MTLIHISFDLETLGNERPNSAIAQIGAVAFPDDDLKPGGYEKKFELTSSSP